MTELTVTQTGAYLGVYNFRRSDGRLFFMRLNQDGSASVFAGVQDGPPQENVGGVDINVRDKVKEAEALILSYKG